MKALKSTIPVFWENHLHEWHETSLSQASYCKEYQLKVHQFGYYKRKQEELARHYKMPGTGFIQLTPEILPSEQLPSLCLRLSKKQSIEGITSETIHLVQPLLACLA